MKASNYYNIFNWEAGTKNTCTQVRYFAGIERRGMLWSGWPRP
jgi:hypothetical protein